MKYRIIKKSTWWTILFNTEQPQYLYYDYSLEHFEVGSYPTVRKHKWIFTKEEIEQLCKDYDLNNEFIVEMVRELDKIDGETK